MIAYDDGPDTQRQPQERADRQQDLPARSGWRRWQRRGRHQRDTQRVGRPLGRGPGQQIAQADVGARHGTGATLSFGGCALRAADRQHVGCARHAG